MQELRCVARINWSSAFRKKELTSSRDILGIYKFIINKKVYKATYILVCLFVYCLGKGDMAATVKKSNNNIMFGIVNKMIP